MLLDNLKVAVLSGDLNGISSHISKEKTTKRRKKANRDFKKVLLLQTIFYLM